jgi:hypothetical protein
MQEFLAATLSFPTVLLTLLLGVSVVYWLLVIAGALGIDALDADVDHGGGMEGAGEGAGEAAGEAGAEALHGAHGHDLPGEVGHEVGADAGHDHTGAHAGHGWFASLLHTLDLKAAPVTVVLSLWIFWAWLFTHLGTHYLLNQRDLGPRWLWGTCLLAGALAGGLAMTTAIGRPLKFVFRTEKVATRADLVGKVVVVDTSRVDARFGSAKAEDGGAGLILAVRCDVDNALARGSRALILQYDEARQAYEVTPVDDIVPSETLEKN